MWNTSLLQTVKEIQKYSKFCYERGLTVATGGNISIKCPQGVLITASGCSLQDITEEDTLLIDFNGQVIQGNPEAVPSKEMFLHLTLYQAYCWTQSIVHVHPRYVTAYSCARQQFPRVTSSAINKLPASIWVDNAPAGSKLLIENLKHAIEMAKQEPRIFILAAHGILTLGKNIREAYYNAELTEECAHIAYLKGVIENSK